MERADRTVHGVTSRAWEVVRYERAGKWYTEPPLNGDGSRLLLTVDDAAYLLSEPDAEWYEGKPGGARLDAKVRAARSS